MKTWQKAVAYFNITMFFIGTILFWAGFHNADLGQNMRWIKAQYGIELVDAPIAMPGYTIDGSGIYRLGCIMMIAGFIVSVANASTIFSLLSAGMRKATWE